MTLIVILCIALYVVLNNDSDKSLKNLFISGIIVGILGGGLSVYVRNVVYPEASGSILSYVFSIAIHTIITMAGIILSKKADLPLWWSNDKTESKWKQICIGAFVGITLGAFLSLLYTLYTVPTETASYSWLSMMEMFKNSNSPVVTAILASVQAAFTEESTFRLLLIPLLVLFIRREKTVNTKLIVITAVLISSIVFALAPTQSFCLGVTMSSIVGFVYVKYGFIPVDLV